MYYYLKINQNQPFAYKNLQNWINVISGFQDAKIIVICDKNEIRDTIVNSYRLSPDITFISSERDEKILQDICNRVTEDRWRFAGYAHLTTFWHASMQRDCEAFWNIDADDTYLCLSEERTREAMRAVEEKAKREGIRAYSLDMHTTRTKGEHWSFGITYTDNWTDWLSYMSEIACSSEWTVAREIMLNVLHLLNIDMFFTFLMKKEYAERGRSVIKTFYYDHAWFLHYSTDFLRLVFFSGLYQWRDGRVFTPVLADLLKAGKYVDGQEIPKEVVDRIDLSITEDESLWGLQRYTFFGPLAEGKRELIDELPLYETERWKILNESIGYRVKEGKTEKDKKASWRDMMNLMNNLYTDGEAIYEMLVKSRPQETEIIVCPEHMGDTLLIAALAKAYKEQHDVKTLIYVSASLPEEVLSLYPSINAVLMMDKDEMRSLQFYITVKKLWYQDGIRYAHFHDDVVLNYPNVSTKGIFDYRKYSLRANRMVMMDLKENSAFEPLVVPAPAERETLTEKYAGAVLLMPVSYSTHLIRDEFWEKLAEELKNRGHQVYTNYNGADRESIIKGTEPFQSTFYELAQMTEIFGLFIGVRSGLCDLISLTGKGNLVILYHESVFEKEGDLVIREEEMKESNIYDLGRREGIYCYRYLSEEENRVIDAVCGHLPE